MHRTGRSWAIGFFCFPCCVLTTFGATGRAEEPPTRVAEAPQKGDEFDRKVDVIYGRKAGLALTMDVFIPKANANGAGVVCIVSGGYFSSRDGIVVSLIRPLVERGYTVFAVVHGSQPQFTVPEIVGDIHRAVRFIRHHASEYQVDPNRIGATGASAGGHLSLMMGLAGRDGNREAVDPVERESSKINAVACFFPPTDYLNYGGAGKELIHAEDFGAMFRPAFEFREIDRSTNLWKRVEEEAKLRQIARDISPIYAVSPDDAPTFILHGDSDRLVPIQQSESLVMRLKEAGVDAKLTPKPKADHGWVTMARDVDLFADWFDAHMPKREPATPAKEER